MDLHEDDIRDLFEATAVLARDPVPTFEVVLERMAWLGCIGKAD